MKTIFSSRSDLVLRIFWLFVCLFICIGCGSEPSLSPTPQLVLGDWLKSPTPQRQIIVTLTPEPVIRRVIILQNGEITDSLAKQVLMDVSEIASQSGFKVETLSALKPQVLSPDVYLVVILTSLNGLADLIASSPNTQFIAAGVPNLPNASNLKVVSVKGIRPDQVDFLAGYIAAVITEDWRVGVLAVSGSSSAQTFKNGVRYFCGLCNPAYEPFAHYPIVVEIPPKASSADWQNAVKTLVVESGVKTVYIAPGAENPDGLASLAKAKVNLIGTQPPKESLLSNWVATLQSGDAAAAVKSEISSLFGDASSNNDDMTVIGNVNPALFSPGKQKLVEQCLQDLMDGLINPVTNK